MAQTILLHGGPWHGQTYSIPDGRDHFHILTPIPPKFLTEEQAKLAEVQVREGTYSRVHGSHIDFEWNGFTSHD